MRRSWRRLAWGATGVVAGCLASGGTRAMDFIVHPLSGDRSEIVIEATGEIHKGDDAKLHAVVGGLASNATLIGITLDSPGGNLVEGVRLARSIFNSHIKTAVGPNNMCASACFLMFASGNVRILFENARVGVHSASDADGEDDVTALSVTTLMAREAKALGVPPAIIGKMVTTPPDDITWLTPDDLRSMDVDFASSQDSSAPSDYVPGSALTPGATPNPAAQPRPAPPVASNATPGSGPANSVPAAPQSSYAFNKGRSDRVAWETWFNGLVGDMKRGAAWWAENRGQAVRQRLTCAMLNPAESRDFLEGCVQARSFLASVDAQRVSDPEYKAGWNSL